jgi:uncharacterized protein YpmB
MFNKHKRKGQSTVEYIILVTAVIIVAIFFLTSSTGPFQKQLNSTMTTATSQMDNMATRWTHAVAPSP